MFGVSVLVVKTRGGTAGSEENSSDRVGSRLEGAGVSKYTYHTGESEHQQLTVQYQTIPQKL